MKGESKYSHGDSLAPKPKAIVFDGGGAHKKPKPRDGGGIIKSITKKFGGNTTLTAKEQKQMQVRTMLSLVVSFAIVVGVLLSQSGGDE